jgi:uncharacterized membrane protein YebE (DUF533 family)
MFNARDLLGQFMQAGTTGSASRRMQHAMGSEGLGAQGNPLSQLFEGLSGSGAATGGGGGSFGGLAEMAKSFLGRTTQEVKGGNPLAIGGIGALAGMLFGGGGGAARGAVGGGALALLGTLAMNALKSWGEGTASDPEQLAKSAPLGVREPQGPAEERELEARALLIVRSMINAAKADGQIDPQELQRIVGRMQADGADSEERRFVEAELAKPADLDAIVREATTPEVAMQVYAASLLAIEVDTPAERSYLHTLADRLGLPREAIRRVHQSLGVSAPQPS